MNFWTKLLILDIISLIQQMTFFLIFISSLNTKLKSLVLSFSTKEQLKQKKVLLLYKTIWIEMIFFWMFARLFKDFTIQMEIILHYKLKEKSESSHFWLEDQQSQYNLIEILISKISNFIISKISLNFKRWIDLFFDLSKDRLVSWSISWERKLDLLWYSKQKSKNWLILRWK